MNNNNSISRCAIIAFALTSLFLFFEMGVQVSPNVMAETLMHDLGINASVLGFISSAYFYSYALMMVPVGLLYDRFKIHHLLIAAIGALTLGNILFALVHSIWMLALARVLMGFGSAFAFVGVLVVARSWFPGRYFAFLVGITQLMAAIGAMMGETPVAFLVNKIGWQHTSLVFAGIGIILLILIACYVREAADWQSGSQPGLISTAIKTVLKKPQSYWVALYAFCSWGPITIFAALWGVPYLMTRFNIANTTAAISPMLVWVALAITSPLLGRYVNKVFSHKTLMQIVMLIGLVGSIALLYLPIHSFTTIVLLSITLGIGAAGQILSFDLVRMNNRDSEFGLATGFNNVGVVFGGAILQPLVGYMLTYNWHGISIAGKTIYSTHNYNLALSIIPLCFAFGLLISNRLIKYTNNIRA